MNRSSAVFLQMALVIIGLVALALLLWEPQVEGRNAHATNFEIYFKDPFLALVYLGSIPFFAALFQAFKLLSYVKENKMFSQESLKALRMIKYCAIAILGFVALEIVFIMVNHGNDDAAGGVAMGILIAFGSIVVVAAAAMFERLLQKAVDLKSENDLTV